MHSVYESAGEQCVLCSISTVDQTMQVAQKVLLASRLSDCIIICEFDPIPAVFSPSKYLPVA